MNVDYYQRQVDRWTLVDTCVRLFSALAASATLVTFLKTNSGDNVVGALSAIAALASIVSATLKTTDRVRELSGLLSEYTRHANRLEHLYQFDGSDDEIKASLKDFHETEERESKYHPKPNEKQLQRSQQRVLESIRAKSAAL